LIPKTRLFFTLVFLHTKRDHKLQFLWGRRVFGGRIGQNKKEKDCQREMKSPMITPVQSQETQRKVTTDNERETIEATETTKGLWESLRETKDKRTRNSRGKDMTRKCFLLLFFVSSFFEADSSSSWFRKRN
jgi:hypothetical protein